MIIKNILLFFVTIFSIFYSINANAVKIVAFVNENVVTDYDVKEFEKVLCKFDQRFKCGSSNSMQMAMLGLIESTLKIEHFKQIDLGNDKDRILKGFYDYKQNVLTNIKIKEKNLPKSFIDYLYSEYIWGIMISSQVHPDEITQSQLDVFVKLHNIKNTDNEQIKQMFIQQKMNDISQQTLSELKKFYLLDIKGL